MGNEPSPQKYMGTQSRETAGMAAALAHTVGATARGDDVIRRLSRERARGGGSVAGDDRISDAASWALE